MTDLFDSFRDRRALKQKAKRFKEEKLLDETRQKDQEEERRRREMDALAADNDGAKFAISRPEPLRIETAQNQAVSASPTGPTSADFQAANPFNKPAEHHFPRSPKRNTLSAGPAKRISPEELNIMLDSYAVESRPKSEALGNTSGGQSVIRRPTKSMAETIEMAPRNVDL